MLFLNKCSVICSESIYIDLNANNLAVYVSGVCCISYGKCLVHAINIIGDKSMPV